jgi:hypothetical protein
MVHNPLSPPNEIKTTLLRGFFVFWTSQACLSEYKETKKTAAKPQVLISI